MTLLDAFISKIYEVSFEEHHENSGRGHYEYGGLVGYDKGESWIEGYVSITFPFYYPESEMEDFVLEYEDEIMDRLCVEMPGYSESDITEEGLQIEGYKNRTKFFIEYVASDY